MQKLYVFWGKNKSHIYIAKSLRFLQARGYRRKKETKFLSYHHKNYAKHDAVKYYMERKKLQFDLTQEFLPLSSPVKKQIESKRKEFPKKKEKRIEYFYLSDRNKTVLSNTLKKEINKEFSTMRMQEDGRLENKLF
jgi:hypothetical protein